MAPSEPYTLAFLPVTGASTSYDVAAERTTTDPVTTVDTTVLSSWSTVSVPAGDSVPVPNFAF